MRYRGIFISKHIEKLISTADTQFIIDWVLSYYELESFKLSIRFYPYQHKKEGGMEAWYNPVSHTIWFTGKVLLKDRLLLNLVHEIVHAVDFDGHEYSVPPHMKKLSAELLEKDIEYSDYQLYLLDPAEIHAFHVSMKFFNAHRGLFDTYPERTDLEYLLLGIDILSL